MLDSIVLDGKVIGNHERNVLEGDFRSNASQGAEVEIIKPIEFKVVNVFSVMKFVLMVFLLS